MTDAKRSKKKITPRPKSSKRKGGMPPAPTPPWTPRPQNQWSRP